MMVLPMNMDQVQFQEYNVTGDFTIEIDETLLQTQEHLIVANWIFTNGQLQMVKDPSLGGSTYYSN